ncbi:hypothetical protein MTO96_013197 [Rhipicephalus appendiculatus]
MRADQNLLTAARGNPRLLSGFSGIADAHRGRPKTPLKRRTLTDVASPRDQPAMGDLAAEAFEDFGTYAVGGRSTGGQQWRQEK